jgi:lipopolysaccharide export system protein LptA
MSSKFLIFFTSFFLIQFNCFGQEMYEVEILPPTQEGVMETVNGETIKRLVGNVKLRHKNNLIDCDSAVIYANNNIDAFGHVVIRKNAQTKVQGNVLHYISMQKIALLNGNVIMTDKKSKLYTEDMTYDLNNDIGYYMQGGKLINDNSEITSQYGSFFTKTSQVLFRQNVYVNHPKYKLTSDSLVYDTKLKRSVFKSSTKIENDSGYIWCNQGWHDEEKNQSTFGYGTYIYNSPHWMLTDSIFYDRKNGKSFIYKTFEYHDTLMKVHVFGDSAVMYNDNKDITAFKRPILILESSDNKPTFIKGDILDVKTLKNDNRIMTAIKNVRMYNADFQGVGDTMKYFSLDSSMYMSKNAFLWKDKYQISGNQIYTYFKNRKPNKMNVYGNALMVQEEDVKNHYNQISSDSNHVYFKDGKMDFMFAYGNAKSIYYGKEEGKGNYYIGLNSTESYSLKMTYDSTSPKTITFYQKPKASFIPVKEINDGNRFLSNFVWKEMIRPKSKDDL